MGPVEFGAAGGGSDSHDIAVVLLERSPGITPAVLPAAGLLDQLKANHELDDRIFTAVGYGTVREDKTAGRMRCSSTASGAMPCRARSTWRRAGYCCPCVSTTITGDAMCRATDKTYRLDTAAAREFLDDFVALP